MIIVILFILTIALFLSWTLIKNNSLRLTTGLISTILLIGAVMAITLNFSQHWGMKKITRVTTHRIYTAGQPSSPAGILIVKRVGTKSNHYVMVYRNHSDDKQASAHFVPDTGRIVDTVKKTANYYTENVKYATVTTTTRHWVWKSNGYKWLLNVGDQNNELITSKSVVTLPNKTWIALTTQQAVKVSKAQAGAGKQAMVAQQAQFKRIMAQKVAVYMQKHPNATKKDIIDYTKKQTAIVTVNNLKAILLKVR